MPSAPDPATPGLLDLLTVGALGEPRHGDDMAAIPAHVRMPAAGRDATSRRDWVEVEA